MQNRIRAALFSGFAALGWVLLALGSLGSIAVALWITLSLSRAAQGDAASLASSTAWTWILAIFVTFGIPFALATWKHHGDAKRISLTMAWLPMVFNAGGLLLATQLIPDLVGISLRSHGAWVTAGRLGDSHSATRVLSALGHHTADLVDPKAPAPDADAPPPQPWAPDVDIDDEVDTEREIIVPFSEEGTAILMDVALEGKNGSVSLPYLFDTGASFTTISTKTATNLGVDVPADAPTLKFNTASGPRESRMVFLPALQLGEVRIAGLLVSVCDACVNERTEGLLGLNVMREFLVTMDYRNHRMNLLPRKARQRRNRSYDIEPVVDLQVEGSPEVWLGRVRWIVLVHNRGTQPIERVTPIVKFSGGPALRGQPVDRIGPGDVGRSLVEGRASLEGGDSSKGLFTITLAEAYW